MRRQSILRMRQDAMIQHLEQTLSEVAEQNMQLQAALRRFLAWQGPRMQMISNAEAQVQPFVSSD